MGMPGTHHGRVFTLRAGRTGRDLARRGRAAIAPLAALLLALPGCGLLGRTSPQDFWPGLVGRTVSTQRDDGSAGLRVGTHPMTLTIDADTITTSIGGETVQRDTHRLLEAIEDYGAGSSTAACVSPSAAPDYCQAQHAIATITTMGGRAYQISQDSTVTVRLPDGQSVTLYLSASAR